MIFSKKPINSLSYRPSLQPSVPVYLDHMLQRYNRRGGIKWQVPAAYRRERSPWQSLTLLRKRSLTSKHAAALKVSPGLSSMF